VSKPLWLRRRDTSIVASGADDKSARLWDMRVRYTQRTIVHPFPVTAVALTTNASTLYTGCLDGRIRVYDLRRPGEVQMTLEGHQA
jgi:Prp8 binding protein